MGILETIEQEIRRQTTEEVTKDSVKKLYRKGFSIDVIAESLEVSVAFVKQTIAE
jgi:transposase